MYWPDPQVKINKEADKVLNWQLMSESQLIHKVVLGTTSPDTDNYQTVYSQEEKPKLRVQRRWRHWDWELEEDSHSKAKEGNELRS